MYCKLRSVLSIAARNSYRLHRFRRFITFLLWKLNRIELLGNEVLQVQDLEESEKGGTLQVLDRFASCLV
jgi:hypothetical protein